MSYIQGAELLRKTVAEYLADTLPEILPIARTATGTTALQLPEPVRYDMYDPYSANDYPVVGMYVVSDRDHEHRDFDAAAEREYWVRYTCRLFVVAVTPKDADGEYIGGEDVFKETIRMRDNLIAVLKNALLGSPSLGGHDVEVLEETISTDYEEPAPVNEKMRKVLTAVGIVNLDIRMGESLYLPALGTVETTNLVADHANMGEDL